MADFFKHKKEKAAKAAQSTMDFCRVACFQAETDALTRQVSKDFDALLKVESHMIHGLSQLLGGSEYTTRQIEDVESGLTRFAENSAAASHHVDAVLQNLDKSSSEIDNAKDSIAKAVQQMNDISEVFRQFFAVFGALEERYKDISNFAGVITNIAQHTNILALNASIEAARAGEAGKGFAVVATEIKNLSNETDKNAKDIISALNRMTDTIKELNEKSNTGSGIVEHATNLIQNTDTLFDNIFVDEHKVHEQMREVQRAQEQNLSEVQRITGSLKNVVEKSALENKQLDQLIFSVQTKADYYQNILNYLNQIKILQSE